jgi:hypothetical protein
MSDENLNDAPAADEPQAATQSPKAEVTDPSETKAAPEADKETEEEAPDTSEDDGSDDDEDDERPKKRRSGLTRLKRELQTAREELETLRSRATPAVDSDAFKALVEREVGPAPKEADFPDWFDFQTAKQAYEADRRIVTRELRKEAEKSVVQQQVRRSEVIEEFKEAAAKAAKAIPDFVETIAKAGDMKAAPLVRDLIVESDKGPLLQYHFAKNPADLKRINELSPVSAAKEIGKLEARLSLAKPNTVTRASPPTPPPKGGAARVNDLSKMSMDEYVKFRRAGKSA